MKDVRTLCKILLVISAGLYSTPLLATQALSQTEATVTSIQPPRLIAARTTYNEVQVRQAMYYFTLEVPTTAKELQQVTFTQTQGSESICFDENNSHAFEGTSKRKGQPLESKLTSDRQNKTVTVTFAQPVPAGKTVTIGLKPERNPTYDGIYLFQVRTFPAAGQSNGQYIGTGRLQFYQNISSDS